MGRSRFVQRGYRLQRVQTGYLCPEQLVESTSDDPVIDPVAMYPSRDCGILIGGAQLSAKTLRSPDVARSSESLVKPPGELFTLSLRCGTGINWLLLSPQVLANNSSDLYLHPCSMACSAVQLLASVSQKVAFTTNGRLRASVDW